MIRKYERMKERNEVKKLKQHYAERGKKMVRYWDKETKKMQVMLVDVPKPFRKDTA